MPTASRIEINLGVEPKPLWQTPSAETPFRIALLGDFSGRANRRLEPGTPPLTSRRPVAVDRDNFDDVLSRFAPQLHLPLGGPDAPWMAIEFRELDDFHPDRLYERLELFRALRQIRRRLTDPSTFAEAAAELHVPRTAEAPAPTPPSPPPVPGRILDQMLEEAEGPAPRLARRPDEFQEFIRRIVAPYLVPGVDPRQSELVAQVDTSAGDQMRSILHQPDFQALEAAWRAVFLLVRRIETDAQLKLFLIDVSKADLAADLADGRDVRSTQTHRLLVESTVGTPGADPWAVLAGVYAFDSSADDLRLLARLAQIAAAAGAPWISAAEPRLAGCESFSGMPDPEEWDRDEDPVWREFRRLPAASSLGLALPRFLLRLPYGKGSDPCEQFQFEEMAGGRSHERYLWGNPAFACALLLAEAFQSHGWNLRPGVCRDVDRLPLDVYREPDGGTVTKPCAEALLTERAAEIILDRGLMPLVSLKDTDTVRLVRFQSIASPAAPLAARWG